jgi:hypothetical protein
VGGRRPRQEQTKGLGDFALKNTNKVQAAACEDQLLQFTNGGNN